MSIKNLLIMGAIVFLGWKTYCHPSFPLYRPVSRLVKAQQKNLAGFFAFD
jgi:hypothetical protein